MTRRGFVGPARPPGLGRNGRNGCHCCNVGPRSACRRCGAHRPLGTERQRMEKASTRRRLPRAAPGRHRSSPHSSVLNAEKRAGTFHCAGCDLPLFASSAKYDSGTGWPSFHTPLPGALGTKTDIKLFLPRTEYHCARCDGHQGHVFKRRTQTQRQALLQQRGGAAFCGGGRMRAAVWCLASLLTVAVAAHAQGPAPSPAPASGPTATAKATFAGGCFWCVESDFDKVPGVLSTTSGYTGGTVANPSYNQVSAKHTGHAEAVEIVFDPAKVSYEQLLNVYWRSIDPTVVDRQFCDVGSPYRTAIFAHGPQQRGGSAGFQGRAGKKQAFPRAHHDADPAGHGFLPGRGLSPGLLHEDTRCATPTTARLAGATRG